MGSLNKCVVFYGCYCCLFVADVIRAVDQTYIYIYALLCANELYSLWAGQEDGVVDVKEGIRFTPFNMTEELEDGHFDSEGTYIFKKDKVTFSTILHI